MPIKGMDEVKKMIAKNKKQANIDIKSIYFSGLRTIIKATPVEEGRAKNNWFLTSGQSFSLSSGRSADKGGGGSDSSLLTMPEYVLNKKIYFTNNLPYIGVLEFGGYPTPGTDKTTGGYSAQLTPFKSPKGWVRATLISMANKVRSL
jgi:hypothetical protein